MKRKEKEDEEQQERLLRTTSTDKATSIKAPINLRAISTKLINPINLVGD